MTDQTIPANAGAQSSADANSIESIIDNATTPATSEPTETPEAEPSEPQAAEAKPEEAFPKKAVNAISRRDKQIGKLKAQWEQAQAEINQLRQQAPQAAPNKPVNEGEPKESDYQNYHDYMRAVQKYDLGQEIAKLHGKQQETQKTAQDKAWIDQREQAVMQKAQEIAKDNPEIIALIEEHADIADDFSPELQRLFLEADNAPLAFYNLAKEGKLEALASMSLAKAAMEIGRAQTQAPTKPKTKAPTPLPASRGSVPSGKSLDDMSGGEIRSWLRSS